MKTRKEEPGVGLVGVAAMGTKNSSSSLLSLLIRMPSS